jgi:hypothetical protein
MLVKKSSKVFFEGLVDYAGLFPPAECSLAEALKRYATYQNSAKAFILGRFIIPLAKVDELVPYRSLFKKKLSLAVVTKNLDRLERIDTFNKEHAEWASIDVLEVAYLKGKAEISVLEKLNIQVYCEFPKKEREEGIEVIVASNADLSVKMRCGGVVAELFPSVDEVVSLILSCRNKGLKMKFTAGLHHPIRHYDDSIGCKMHGFVNIFSGGMIAHVHDLESEQLSAIISDEEPTNFTFDGAGFSWKGKQVTWVQVEALRKSSFSSYGSCSFEEPIDDLKTLGYLL